MINRVNLEFEGRRMHPMTFFAAVKHLRLAQNYSKVNICMRRCSFWAKQAIPVAPHLTKDSKIPTKSDHPGSSCDKWPRKTRVNHTFEDWGKHLRTFFSFKMFPSLTKKYFQRNKSMPHDSVGTKHPTPRHIKSPKWPKYTHFLKPQFPKLS